MKNHFLFICISFFLVVDGTYANGLASADKQNIERLIARYYMTPRAKLDCSYFIKKDGLEHGAAECRSLHLQFITSHFLGKSEKPPYITYPSDFMDDGEDVGENHLIYKTQFTRPIISKNHAEMQVRSKNSDYKNGKTWVRASYFFRKIDQSWRIYRVIYGSDHFLDYQWAKKMFPNINPSAADIYEKIKNSGGDLGESYSLYIGEISEDGTDSRWGGHDIYQK